MMEENKMTQDERTAEKQQRFHAHLDVCAQCRNHPFELCPAGAAILLGSDARFVTQYAPEIHISHEVVIHNVSAKTLGILRRAAQQAVAQVLQHTSPAVPQTSPSAHQRSSQQMSSEERP